MNGASTYGMVAEFDDPTALLEAARKIKERGYRKVEAYTPYPIKDLHEVIHVTNWVPFICLSGGLAGAATAWVTQYYIAAIEYPINVGGRPLYSWPSFIPILFELAVLLAGCSAFFGVLVLCGFPGLISLFSTCRNLRMRPAAECSSASKSRMSSTIPN